MNEINVPIILPFPDGIDKVLEGNAVKRDDGERGIPPDLLELWDEEDKKNAEKAGTFLPQQKRGMFNDNLWDHQWYMVRGLILQAFECLQSTSIYFQFSARHPDALRLAEHQPGDRPRLRDGLHGQRRPSLCPG